MPCSLLKTGMCSNHQCDGGSYPDCQFMPTMRGDGDQEEERDARVLVDIPVICPRCGWKNYSPTASAESDDDQEDDGDEYNG